MSNSKKIVSEIRSVLDEIDGMLPKGDVDNARELLECNEWGESLTTICTQLYEYESPISQKMYDKIASIGQEMGLESKEWNMLQEIVANGDE